MSNWRTSSSSSETDDDQTTTLSELDSRFGTRSTTHSDDVAAVDSPPPPPQPRPRTRHRETTAEDGDEEPDDQTTNEEERARLRQRFNAMTKMAMDDVDRVLARREKTIHELSAVVRQRDEQINTLSKELASELRRSCVQHSAIECLNAEVADLRNQLAELPKAPSPAARDRTSAMMNQRLVEENRELLSRIDTYKQEIDLLRRRPERTDDDANDTEQVYKL